MEPAATAMSSVQESNDEHVRNIMDSERSRLLKLYRTIEIEKWLENELTRNKEHKLHSTQEEVKAKNINSTCQQPEFVCAVEVVRTEPAHS